MKKLLLLCALLTGCAAIALCAEPSKTDAKVHGVWQWSVTNRANGKTVNMPVWKIYCPDGSFITVSTASGISEQPSRATCAGTYDVRPDGVIVEKIEKSSNGFRPGDKNALAYSVDGNAMTVEFTNKSDRKVRETWRRVCHDVDAAKAAKGAKRAAKYGLAGLWQKRLTTGSGRRVYLPVYKIIRTDGTFDVIENTPEKAEPTVQGYYRIDSKTDYTEFVTRTATDPDLLGRGNRISCTYLDDGSMLARYRMPGRSADAVEEWVRVVCR